MSTPPDDRRAPFDIDEPLRWPGEELTYEPDEIASENVTAFDAVSVEEVVDEEPEPAQEPLAEAAADEAAPAEVEESVVVEEIEVAEPEREPEPEVVEAPQHAPGELRIPDGVTHIEGTPLGGRRTVGIVVSRYNGEVTGRLLDSAFEELERVGISRDLVTVLTVPGAFELPLAAMALAKTRKHSCVVALGCVIRGETPHFDFVAGEAASGLQLAALETGIPVSFGLLTLENAEQADARIEKGAEAVRSGLEMADAFAQLRVTAAASG